MDGRIKHVEAAGKAAQGRQQQAVGVGGEAAAATAGAGGCARRALGWRWPTISPTSPVACGAARGRPPPARPRPHRPAPAAATGSWLPVTQTQRRCPGHARTAGRTGRATSSRRTAPIVEAVAQADHRVRAVAGRSAPPAGPAWRGCRRAAGGCRGARRRCPSPGAGRPRSAWRSAARTRHRPGRARESGRGVPAAWSAGSRSAMASATSSATASSRDSSSSSPATNSLPMPAMIATAKGEMRSRCRWRMRPCTRDQQVGQAADVGQARRRLGPCRAQQHVVGVVLAQHVVDQVGAEGDLAAGLLLARMAALDQARDHGAVAEGPLDQRALGHPLLEIVAQDVDVEQARRRRVDRLGAPDGDAVVGGRRSPAARRPTPLHAAGQQHAQGLVRVAAGEAVGDQVVPRPPRAKVSTSSSSAAVQPRAPRLRRQPLAAPAAAAGARSTGRPGGGARGRPDAWSAAACRRHRPAPSGRGPPLASVATTSFCADALEAPAAGRRTGTCRRASSIETKYSSTSPSTLPRPSRTRITGASTMVPTFIRYWRVSLGSLSRHSPSSPCGRAAGSARRSASA